MYNYIVHPQKYERQRTVKFLIQLIMLVDHVVLIKIFANSF